MAGTSWMDERRSDLIEHYHYLGTTDVRDEVVWRDIGPYDILVTKESADEEDARIRIAETEGKEAKNTLQEGTSDGSNIKSEPQQLDVGGSLLVHAPLTFVGLISPHDFRLMSDGNWSGSTEFTKFTKTFAEVKLNGRVIIPTNITAFANDFSTVLQNVEWFMKNNETPRYKKRGIFRENSPHESIKLRHVLFEKTDQERADPKDVKSMEKWPVQLQHIEAQAQLKEMKYSYRVLPLPAYDIQGTLIPPAEYLTALKGAVVRVTVHLKHWAIARDCHDSYTADIQNLRVLVAAPKIPSDPLKSPPEKRKPPPSDPGAASKKARLGARV